MLGSTGTGLVHERDRRPIEAFVHFDRLAAVAGLVFLVVVNGLLVRSAMVWLIVPPIIVLIAALTVAGRRLVAGSLVSPMVLLSVGNWLVALTVAAVLPFVWPVMVITVLMPVVLVTSYVDRDQLVWLIAGAAVSTLSVAGFGLLNEDGGALPDVEDGIEVAVVMGALIALVVPCGLIVWHTNRIQLEELRAAAALNTDLRLAQDELLSSRRRVVAAADRERLRIERDLHDGAQQTLVALGVRLRLLAGQAADHPELASGLDELMVEADRAVEELRELAHGIYPPVLQSQGLPAALRGVTRRSPLTVEGDLADTGRFEASAEHALYFVALEAMTNVAKHAAGATVRLELDRSDDRIRLTVSDDGPGFVVETLGPSGGADNMGDRVAAVGGDLRIESAPGAGTTIVAAVPVVPRPADGSDAPDRSTP